MTTNTQVKRLLKPLLDRRKDLYYASRTVFLRPVRHILRSVLCDCTGDPDRMSVGWYVQPLFLGEAHYYLNWGDELASGLPGGWQHSNPATQQILIEQIEQVALPRLAELDDIAAFFRLQKEITARRGYRVWPRAQLILELAMGDFDAARVTCAAFTSRDVNTLRSEEAREYHRGAMEFCTLLAADDRQGLADLLHEREAYAVKHLKLEAIWEQTPFPFQEA